VRPVSPRRNGGRAAAGGPSGEISSRLRTRWGISAAQAAANAPPPETPRSATEPTSNASRTRVASDTQSTTRFSRRASVPPMPGRGRLVVPIAEPLPATNRVVSAARVGSAVPMPVRRRSWVMCRLSMRLPDRSSSSKTTCMKPASLVSSSAATVMLLAGARRGDRTERRSATKRRRPGTLLRLGLYALEMLPVWCSTCASGPGMITTVSVSPSHLTT